MGPLLIANTVLTVAIAIYLASTRDPQRRLAAYTAGVFAVYVSALAEQRMGHKDRGERQAVQRVEHGQQHHLPRKREIRAHDRADRGRSAGSNRLEAEARHSLERNIRGVGPAR